MDPAVGNQCTSPFRPNPDYILLPHPPEDKVGRMRSDHNGMKHSGKQMSPAPSMDACAMACSASVIDSSGVIG